MKYTGLGEVDRARLWNDLETMPAFLAERFADLTSDEARTQSSPGDFSPVEHCWHLADLEREGYGVRIARLRAEAMPRLPDFDGGRLAEEREYRKKSLRAAIESFEAARRDNLAALSAVTESEWSRAGVQDGAGEVALCDIPAMMAEHDRAHRGEIEAWRRALGR